MAINKESRNINLSVLHSRRLSKQDIENKKIQDKWPIYRSKSLSYSRTFRELLHPILIDRTKVNIFYDENDSNKQITRKSVKEISYFLKYLFPRDLIRIIVDRLKQAGNEVRMLDLMSYGAILSDLNVKGCAVALTDKRSIKDRYDDLNNQRIFIEGDIMSKRTWHEISLIKKSNFSDQPFNMILCRPLSGIENIARSSQFYNYMIYQVYALLSPDYGIFLTEFHGSMRSYVETGTRQLNSFEGIEAYCHSKKNIFMMIKHPNCYYQLQGFTDEQK